MKTPSIEELANAISEIKRMDEEYESGETVAWNTAYSLLEILDSSKKINRMIKKIMKSDDVKDSEEIIFEIGEELRHVLYHIRDSRYYRYII